MSRSIVSVGGAGVVVLSMIAGCYSAKPQVATPQAATRPAVSQPQPQQQQPAEPRTMFRSTPRVGHLEVVIDHADVQLTLRLAGTAFETHPESESVFRIDGQEVFISVDDFTAPPGATTEQILTSRAQWLLGELSKELSRPLGPTPMAELKAPDGSLSLAFSVEVPADLAKPGVVRSAYALRRVGSHIVTLGSPLPAPWEPGMTNLLSFLSTLTSRSRK